MGKIQIYGYVLLCNFRSLDIQKKKFLDFSKFEQEEKENRSLKKYLDSNRYSIGLQYKMMGDYVSAKKYLKNIHLENLNWKHQLLLKQPKIVLVLLKQFQTLLIRFFKIKLSSFKQ